MNDESHATLSICIYLFLCIMCKKFISKLYRLLLRLLAFRSIFTLGRLYHKKNLVMRTEDIKKDLQQCHHHLRHLHHHPRHRHLLHRPLHPRNIHPKDMSIFPNNCCVQLK